MDMAAGYELFAEWLIHHGPIVLFCLLIMGILLLPIPEETLMIISGVLMSKGKLNLPLTLLAAYGGSICGISLSYLLGRTAGHRILLRYGERFGLTSEKLERAHVWFERYGKWTLPIGYFIPGIRHFTGFASGMTVMDFRQFALFAYTGAIIWVSLFLSIGYYSGQFLIPFIQDTEALLDQKVLLFTLFVFILAIGYAKWRAIVRLRSKR